MKTVCVHIPRSKFQETDAMLATVWDIHEPGLLEEMLGELHESIRDPFSLEMFSTRQTTYLCVTAQEPTISIVTGAIYSIFPKCQILEVPDFTLNPREYQLVATAEVKLTRDSIYPLQDYTSLKFGSISPLTSVFSRMRSEDQAIVQLVIQPAKDTAALHFTLDLRRMIDRFKQIFRVKYWFKRGLSQQIAEKNREKAKSKLFRANLRVAVLSPGVSEVEGEAAADKVYAKMKNSPDLNRYLEGIVGALACVNTLDLNSIRVSRIRHGVSALKLFQERWIGSPFYLTNREICTLWHIPSLGGLPNTAQVLSLKNSPPKILPTDVEDPRICLFGQTDYRDHIVPFGILRDDRRRHVYIVGKSGVGKSKLIELLARNDIDDGFGCAVLDPHGDLVDDILKFVPRQRVNDVVVFDPSDLQYPPSFNPLEGVPDELRTRVTVGFVEVFRRLFANSWSERLEHLMRYCILALLSTKGSTMLSIAKLLKDENYRRSILENVDDPVVRSFWAEEFPNWSDSHYSDAVIPLLDKVSQFLSTDMIRNVVGQTVNKFDFRDIIANQKILLMKVSTGILGEENASLLGALIVRKIYQAAMSQEGSPEDRRDFYFYVDEFHNFATSSFAEILGESRKYRLNLTVANQFVDQLPEPIQKAIFGNVGNLVTFRVGGRDATRMAAELKSKFEAADLLHLALRDFYIRMMIDGESQEPFSGRTLEMVYPPENNVEQCIEHSRKHYAEPLEEVLRMLGRLEEAA